MNNFQMLSKCCHEDFRLPKSVVFMHLFSVLTTIPTPPQWSIFLLFYAVSRGQSGHKTLFLIVFSIAYQFLYSKCTRRYSVKIYTCQNSTRRAIINFVVMPSNRKEVFNNGVIYFLYSLYFGKCSCLLHMQMAQ